MTRDFDWERLPAAWRYGDVKIDGIGRDAVDRAGLAPEFSTDDAHVHAVVVLDLRYVQRLYFLVERCGHLQRRRQVRPQLEAVHAAGRVALGHLLVDDAAARGHPLDVAGGDGAAITHAVAVLDGSGEDVSNGLDAPMRVPWEARQIIFGNIVAKIVEKEERVKIRGVAEAERAAQVYACAFHRWLGFDEPFHGSNRHGASGRESLLVDADLPMRGDILKFRVFIFARKQVKHPA